MHRRIRMGMVGGGPGAFIGPVHRMAATLDNQVELVCGCFDPDPARSQEGGRTYFIPKERVYDSYQQMFEQEMKRPDGDRMDFVTVVTPNHLHYPVAKAALERGFHVMCEKPMTVNLEEAKELEKLVNKTGLFFALTHSYTGYPLVKHARALVKSGKLGKIRKVVVEYPQGWLATRLEASGQMQASWRTDPRQAGLSCCMADIGIHADNLVSYVTGLEVDELCADLTTFVQGRPLDDDGNVLVHYKGGARGITYASQVSIDDENDLTIRVYGEKGGLEWHQIEPNTLILKYADRPRECLRAGGGYAYLSNEARLNCRLPAGHPEGLIESVGNIYRNFALSIRSKLNGETPKPEHMDYPGVKDGVRGMAYVEAVVKSSKNHAWVKFPS